MKSFINCLGYPDDLRILNTFVPGGRLLLKKGVCAIECLRLKHKQLSGL